MALTITIDGVDRTDNVYRTPGGTIRFSMAIGSDWIADFPLYDMDGTSGAYRPSLGDDVLIEDNGTEIFHGRIDRISDGPVGGTGTGTLSLVTAKAISAVVDQVIVTGTYAGVADLVIANASLANPTSITTTQPHGLTTGNIIRIDGVEGSTPALDGDYTVTVTSHSTFTVPVNVTNAGVGGQVRRIYTLKTLVSDLRTTYLNSYGITLDAAMADGPYLEGPTFKDASLREIFNHFSTITGYLWRITPDDELQFFAVGVKTASYSLTSTNKLSLGPITWDTARDKYVNDVRLRYGSDSVIPKTQYVTGDGSTNVWALDYTPAVDASGVIVSAGYVADTGTYSPLGLLSDISTSSVANPTTITTTQPHGFGAGTTVSVVIQSHSGSTPAISGTYTATITGLRTFTIPVNVTVAGTGGSVYQANLVWLYYPTTNSLYRVGALTSEHKAEFAYSAQFPQVVTASDSGEIASNGQYAAMFEAPDIFDTHQAQDLADGLLRKYLSTPKMVKLSTRAGFVMPGDAITLTFTNRTISGTHIVTQVQARDAQLDGTMEYDLTCMSGSEIHETYVDQLRDVIGAVGGSRAAGGLITGGLIAAPSGLFIGPVQGNKVTIEKDPNPTLEFHPIESPDPDATERRTVALVVTSTGVSLNDTTRADLDAETTLTLIEIDRASYTGSFLNWGAWQNVTYSSGNFTASAGTWGVDSGDVIKNRWCYLGAKTICWQALIQNTDVSNAGVFLQATLPNSFTLGSSDASQLIRANNAGGGTAVGMASWTSGQTAISLCATVAAGTFTNTTGDNTSVVFSLIIEIE